MGFVDDVAKFTLGLLQEVVGTRAWSVFLLFWLILVLFSFVIGSALGHLLPPSTPLLGIVTAFSAYSFLFGGMLNSWRAEVKARRYAKIRRYVDIVEKSQFTIKTLEGLFMAVKRRGGASATLPSAADTSREEFLTIRDAVIVMTWYSYRLFYAADPGELVSEVRGLDTYKLVDMQLSTARTIELFSKNPVELANSLISVIVENMESLRFGGYVNDVFINDAMTSLKNVMKSISSIAVESTIIRPRFYDFMSGMMASFWIFVWMPVNFWVAIGTIATAGLYPFIALWFTSEAIFDLIKGNTFDRRSEIIVGSPHDIRKVALEMANEMARL